jgi:transposase
MDPRYTSKTCSKCGHVECPSGHVDHADVNASFGIGKPVLYCIVDRFDVDRDTLKGSTDTPKEATLTTTETLEPIIL